MLHFINQDKSATAPLHCEF